MTFDTPCSSRLAHSAKFGGWSDHRNNRASEMRHDSSGSSVVRSSALNIPSQTVDLSADPMARRFAAIGDRPRRNRRGIRCRPDRSTLPRVFPSSAYDIGAFECASGNSTADRCETRATLYAASQRRLRSPHTVRRQLANQREALHRQLTAATRDSSTMEQLRSELHSRSLALLALEAERVARLRATAQQRPPTRPDRR